MDYEKAYKAVLQTAKQWIKDGCTDKEKICLECVFPELHESEDERKLDAIIKIVKETKLIDWNYSNTVLLEWLESKRAALTD